MSGVNRLPSTLSLILIEKMNRKKGQNRNDGKQNCRKLSILFMANLNINSPYASVSLNEIK